MIEKQLFSSFVVKVFHSNFYLEWHWNWRIHGSSLKIHSCLLRVHCDNVDSAAATVDGVARLEGCRSTSW